MQDVNLAATLEYRPAVFKLARLVYVKGMRATIDDQPCFALTEGPAAGQWYPDTPENWDAVTALHCQDN